MTTARDVAQFMAEELARVSFLHQETVVGLIIMKFGREWTGINANGNSSINKDVLTAFNKLTPDAVWERGERMWRPRQPYDKPGRQQ